MKRSQAASRSQTGDAKGLTKGHAIALVAAKAAFGATMALGIALAPSGHAEAPGTVNLTDLPDIDSYPICHVEDCSDVPDLDYGLWQARNGDWYLEQGERTWLIIDNTVTPAARDMDPEEVLDQHAGALGIDRGDERSFDSSEFPKVIFWDQVDMEYDWEWLGEERPTEECHSF